MNNYERVERITDLTDKGKFVWKELYTRIGMWTEALLGYRGSYKNMVAELEVLNEEAHELFRAPRLYIEGSAVDVDRRCKKRLQRAIERQIAHTERVENIKEREKRRQKIDGILRG